MAFLLAPALEGGSWAVCYSERPTAGELAPFGLLVLDDRHHPPLEPLRAEGKTLLGYLSIGEVEKTRPYFAAARREGLLVEENPDWKGSYRVDMRNRRWRWRVVNQIVPALLRMGFHGVFLDTADVAGYLEEKDPKRFAGMRKAAVDLVREIRKRHPAAKVMMNRGFDLLPELAGELDAVLAESTRARYDFGGKVYRRTPDEEYRQAVNLLREAAQRFPSLTVYTLDYWDPDDALGVREIYREQRANGFAPYVSTILLDRVIAEPEAAPLDAEGLP
ncbi:MAG: endo alpha-1,4 polygalactosaminidase [Bryobacteraceae bacterium]